MKIPVNYVSTRIQTERALAHSTHSKTHIIHTLECVSERESWEKWRERARIRHSFYCNVALLNSPNTHRSNGNSSTYNDVILSIARRIYKHPSHNNKYSRGPLSPIALNSFRSLFVHFSISHWTIVFRFVERETTLSHATPASLIQYKIPLCFICQCLLVGFFLSTYYIDSVSIALYISALLSLFLCECR